MNRKAFSLIELMTVVAVIAVLASLLLPALNRAKQKAWGIQCLQNQRSMFQGWYQESTDNNERLLFSTPDWGYEDYVETLRNSWVTNDYQSNTWVYFVKDSPLWPYVPAKSSWKCPSNRTSPDLSQAMNWYVGGHNRDWEMPGFTFRKMCQFTEPSRFFVFADMKENNLYGSGSLDSIFLVEPVSFGDQFDTLPVTSHASSGSFVFADGHAQNHRWLGPIKYGVIGGPDVVWLQEHATRF